MRVLLVEDDPELRRRLTERLVAAGIAVDSAASAGDARPARRRDRTRSARCRLRLAAGAGLSEGGIDGSGWKSRRGAL